MTTLCYSFILFYCLLKFDSSSVFAFDSDYASSTQTNRLNSVEIEHFTYHFILNTTLHVNSDESLDTNYNNNLNIIKIKSQNGQTYECSIPQLPLKNEYDDFLPEIDDEKNFRANYDLQLINQKVQNLMNEVKESVCIHKVKNHSSIQLKFVDELSLTILT
jgi:hypothetical protein